MPYSQLDAKQIFRPILHNYNQHVLIYINMLEEISCELVYEGSSNLRDHIRDKTVYACDVRSYNNQRKADNPKEIKKKYKSLKCLLPVMIGSNLDHCIRKRGLVRFNATNLNRVQFLNDLDTFHTADIACTFFLINGLVKHLPYFFTNDATNAHIVRGQKLVRCYTYDADDRGKEMTYYASNDFSKGNYLRGDVVVVLNDGSTVLNDCDRGFFDHCPYSTDQAAYLAKVYRDGHFDIDHLGNKIVVSPGHLFVKLFMKYLYRPLKKGEWSVVKSKHAMVVKSIVSGTLLHVLSKKTVYFKDSPSTMTVVNNVFEGTNGSKAEMGTCSGSTVQGTGQETSEVYVEKNTGCYREINMQTYPLNPYLSHLITRQISSKVKKSNIVAFHPSYVGFLCLVGTFETKNVGRTGTMVRRTVVTTREDVERVYRFLRLQEEYSIFKDNRQKPFYVVVNEACIPVTRETFEGIDLERMKRRLKFVECYREGRFIFIRKKMGLFFKRLVYFDWKFRQNRRRKINFLRTIWVTARDEMFWKKRFAGRLQPIGYDQLTSYVTDLNPFFHHNVFTKNILAYNTLKNAVLSTDPQYSEYFMETLSVFTPPSPRHRVVCKPVDAFSARFALRVPLLTVAYASFEGLNQEDCIVVNRDLRSFDSYRFHTVRLKFDTPSRYVTFHPTRAEPPDPECYLMGHLVCHDRTLDEFRVVPLTMHVKLEAIGRKMYKVYFNKPRFRITSVNISENRLCVCLTRIHRSATGDKLSSFHGQKGVARRSEGRFPVFVQNDRFGNECHVVPDLLVNPYCMFRQTCGQFREGLYRGGMDYKTILNAEGKRMDVHSHGIFVGDTFYFSISYYADEHEYAPTKCKIDPILGQAVKGRSRFGGMRLGNMEILNGLRGNGLAACFEEKVVQDGDVHFYREPKNEQNPFKKGTKREIEDEHSGKKKAKTTYEDKLAIPIPKSAPICVEEMKYFKCLMQFSSQNCFQEER